ncbi:MAG: acetyltransferase [Actinomycetota bacterium]|nr:acetyltransferase [Actinomycetota bacterium]
MTERPRLVIVGDRVFAEIAHEYFTHDSGYEVVGFSVERDYIRDESFRGLPMVPFESLEEAFDPAEHSVHVAITYLSFNRVRARLAAEARDRGYALASYVSSRAFVWPNAELGEHCFVFEDNTVQPFVRVGDNVVLWSGNHIGHHSRIGDNCFISSHVVVSGGVEVGENTFIGVNSTLVNDITIGRDSWIGPGVTITRDVEPGSFWTPPRSTLRDESALDKFLA